MENALKESQRARKRVPPSLYITPGFIILTALFYALRNQTSVMDWFGAHIAIPVRSFMGMLSSAFPFSVAEILCTLAAVSVLFYIIKSTVSTVRAQNKLKELGKRLISLLTAILGVWCCFCWLWGSAYFETGFAEKNGFSASGVTASALERTTLFYAQKAGELAPLVKRDSGGHFAENRQDYFSASSGIYSKLSFAGLNGKQYMPKSMMYSSLMSRLGFTGFYFAFTGEANINTSAPSCLIPATIAHELAHQRGVSAEEEANFLAVAACVTSGNTVYEYSGYLMGYIHLSNALYETDPSAWRNIRSALPPELVRDLEDNSEYWRAQKSDTGAGKAVTAFYDGYLKSYGQELGIRSYGACIDLLIEWTGSYF